MKLNYRTVWIGVAATMIAGSGHYPAKAQAGFISTVVAPNIGNEGNSAGNDPFDGLLTSSRYQQVFDASEFAIIQNGGGFVSFMALRLDSICGGQGQTIPNFQINLSTTSRGPDSLSSVFAENVGSDDTSVLGPGSFTIFGACDPSSMPQSFNMFIRFNRPFFYDPNAGNLLLDLRNHSGSLNDGSLLRVDGHDVVGDSVSSIFAFNVGLPNANQVSSFGYVALFQFAPVPEPSTWALLVLGAVICAAHRVFQRRKRAGTDSG